MAIPTVYRSDDASAPVITGTAGDLVTALDTILVNGYGAKSAAGWTAPYTGTNKRVYRQGSGPQHYLRVDDADARLSRVVGYGAMTDVDTGTNPFPTSAQISGGLYVRKSTTTGSTARPWICFATNTTFYLFIYGARTATLPTASHDGGDANLGFGTLINTRVSGDINASFLCAGSDTSATSTATTDTRQCLISLGTSAQTTLYTNGSYNQGSSASVNCYKRSSNFYQISQSGAGGTAFPEATRGALLLYPFVVIEPTGIVRGDFPGIYSLGHAAVATGTPGHLVIVDGRGAYSGRSFYRVNTGSVWGVAIETTGGW
jgi:hypothetical protein